MTKKFYSVVGVLSACLVGTTCLGIVGCAGGMGTRYTYYEDASRYALGEVALSSERIFGVDIDWVDGEIEIERSADGQLRIREENPSQDEEAQMRYFVSHGVVKVQYCASGYRGKIDGGQKRLLVEIPPNFDLDIESARAEISVGVAQFNRFSVENRFGDLSAEKISCQHAEIETMGGSVRIGELLAKSCTVESKTGDIALGLSGAMDAELETERGNIALYPHGVRMRIDFQTRGGRVITEREYERKGSVYEFSYSSTENHARENELCTIEVETVGGDLRVY